MSSSSSPAVPAFSDRIRWQALTADHAGIARRMAADVDPARTAVADGFEMSDSAGHATALSWTARLGSGALAHVGFLCGFRSTEPLVLDPPRWDYPAFVRDGIEKLEPRRKRIATLLSSGMR